MTDDKHGGHLEASHARRPDFQLDDRPIPGGPPIAPDKGWWSRVDKRHRGWIVAGGVAGVVVLAVGIGVAVAMIGSSLASPHPAPTSTAATAASSPATIPVTTTSPSATETTAATGSTQPTTAPVATSLVAYRKAGAVWVAGQDGSSPRMLFTSASGQFALSPDGATLAVVDDATHALSLVDVATGRTTTVGSAVPRQPGWAPDSSYLVYTLQPSGAHDTEIERVSRDGSGRQQVGPGGGACVAPDGSIVAVSATHDVSGHPAVVYKNGSQTLIGRTLTVNAVAPIPGRVVLADAGSFLGNRRAPSIDTVGYDGAGQKLLVSKPSASAAYFGVLDPSPDGSWVAYTETGDDGYSRMFAVPSAGGKHVALSLVRDDYILGWSSDGSEILFIEGNQVQNEPTRLMAVRPDGTKRRVIIEGAGI